MILLVTGGRDFADRNLVWKILDHILFDELIHGGCPTGADYFADLWSRNRGHKRVRVFPAEWDKFGNRAGPIRNALMLEQGKPNLVVAFPGGPGTANMVQLAKQEKVPVLKVNW